MSFSFEQLGILAHRPSAAKSSRSASVGLIGGFVKEDMKQVLPYIQIGMHNDEHLVVVVGDYELADFI